MTTNTTKLSVISPRPTRTVTFSPEIRVREIPTIQQEDVDSLWLSPADYFRIKREAKMIVNKVSGLFLMFEDDESLNTRGLEILESDGIKNMQRNRLATVTAVLSEQERQRKQSGRITDVEAIAQASIFSSMHLAKEATIVAEQDARSVQKYLASSRAELQAESKPVSTQRFDISSTTTTIVSRFWKRRNLKRSSPTE